MEDMEKTDVWRLRPRYMITNPMPVNSLYAWEGRKEREFDGIQRVREVTLMGMNHSDTLALMRVIADSSPAEVFLFAVPHIEEDSAQE